MLRISRDLSLQNAFLHACSLALDQRPLERARGCVLLVLLHALSKVFRRGQLLPVALRLNRGLCVVVLRLLEGAQTLGFRFGDVRCV